MNSPNNRITILGGGLGALVSGAILSKHGFRVTILEQHHKVGGCLQGFTRGKARFDTGMHYIGSLGDGKLLNKIWHYLELLPQLQIKELDPDGFDVIRLSGKDYKFAAGSKAFVDTLSSQFPDQRQNLQNYIDEMTKMSHLSIFSDHDPSNEGMMVNPYLNIAFDDYLNGNITDSTLRNVLLGNILLYAAERHKTPFYLGATINQSYIDGAYRIVGGSEQVADILAQSIVDHGGEILLNKCVERINCTDGRATSVTLSDKTEVEADYFISDLHPTHTVQMITPQSAIRKSYRERITGMDNTIASFSLYLHFKAGTVPYMNHNFYSYLDGDLWDCTDCRDDRFGRNYLYMHQYDTAQQLFTSNAVILTYMDYRDVAAWHHSTGAMQRGDDYDAFMEKCASKLLARLESDFPGIGECIESHYTASPLTYSHYTRTPNGSLYGTLMDVNAPMGGIVTHWSKIPNLFYVGQNSYLHGMLGVTIGAILACGEFVDLDKIIQEIKNSKSLFKNISE